MAENVIVDTSAFIEYFLGTSKGSEVKKVLADDAKVILVPSIVLCELASKLDRSGLSSRIDIISELSAFHLAENLNFDLCLRAGRIHSNLRKVEKHISLADCILIAIGEHYGNALILTTDTHFKHYKNSKIL